MHLVRRIHSESSRRLVGLCTLCALVLGTIGVPVPQLVSKNQSGKDQSQPFPCQQRACGCMDAASCWKSCCCHTNREKLAWAKQHGVTPPAFVVAAAAQEGGSTAKSCCAAKTSVAKTSAAKTTVAKECCETNEGGETEEAAPQVKTALGLVLLNDARKCQGHSSLVLLLMQTVAEIREVEFDFQPVAGEIVTPTSIYGESLLTDLDAPPPRASYSPHA